MEILKKDLADLESDDPHREEITDGTDRIIQEREPQTEPSNKEKKKKMDPFRKGINEFS